MDYTQKVAVPPPTDINTGVEPCHLALMMEYLGTPGPLSRECSAPTNGRLKAKIRTASVGPFRVTGHVQAISVFSSVFADVRAAEPALYTAVQSNGMLCCRAVRGANVYSNHSWGMALDLQVGEFDPYGSRTCSQGLLSLYKYMHAHGVYWGAGFGGSRTDAMHWEPGAALIQQWQAAGLLV